MRVSSALYDVDESAVEAVELRVWSIFPIRYIFVRLWLAQVRSKLPLRLVMFLCHNVVRSCEAKHKKCEGESEGQGKILSQANSVFVFPVITVTPQEQLRSIREL